MHAGARFNRTGVLDGLRHERYQPLNDGSFSGGRADGDKRERILTAAERIFARHGFFAAKVSDVAKEAGVADGTIYLYFKSKDDLLISLFERRMQQVNEALRAAIARQAARASSCARSSRRTCSSCTTSPPPPRSSRSSCARAASS